jgi:hypothetical protein
MNVHDELKELREKISDLNWRMNATRAAMVPATDPEVFSFLDHFSDADIFWAWKQLGTSGGVKFYTEAGSVITFTATGLNDCRWTGAVNGALKLSIGHPGLPCEITTKINSVGFAVDALAHAGLWMGVPEGSVANAGIMFGRRDTGLYAYCMDGTTHNLVALTTLPIWLKMRISGALTVGYRVSFQYSIDGIAWTTYQSIPPNDFYWWGTSTPATQNIGLVLRATAGNCAATIPFEFFRATRIFGPGGS